MIMNDTVPIMNEKLKEKINESKFNRLSKMKEISLEEEENLLLQKLRICKKTLRKWKNNMKFIEKIGEVKIDRALKEMIFSSKSQIECFEYLTKEFNYFATYDEVKQHINITRYLYKIVKKYIQEELSKINS